MAPYDESSMRDFYSSVTDVLKRNSCMKVDVNLAELDVPSYFNFSDVKYNPSAVLEALKRDESFKRELGRFIESNAKPVLSPNIITELKDRGKDITSMPIIKEDLERFMNKEGMRDPKKTEYYLGLIRSILADPGKYMKADFEGDNYQSMQGFDVIYTKLTNAFARAMDDIDETVKLKIRGGLTGMMLDISSHQDRYLTLSFVPYNELKPEAISGLEAAVSALKPAVAAAARKSASAKPAGKEPVDSADVAIKIMSGISSSGPSNPNPPDKNGGWRDYLNYKDIKYKAGCIWHTTWFSEYGKLYRRAKVNERRKKKGKITDWTEVFTVGEKTYKIHGIEELEALSIDEKVNLSVEYNKRKLRDWIMIGALVVSSIPEITGFSLWAYEKMKNGEEVPPLKEYVLPGRLTERTKEVIIVELPPIYLEDECRKLFPVQPGKPQPCTAVPCETVPCTSHPCTPQPCIPASRDPVPCKSVPCKPQPCINESNPSLHNNPNRSIGGPTIHNNPRRRQ